MEAVAACGVFGDEPESSFSARDTVGEEVARQEEEDGPWGLPERRAGV